MKIKDINFFFGFPHSYRGLTPLKLRNFGQKLIISKNTRIFAQRSSRESLINTSLHHAMKIQLFIFIFFWISSLFSWANSFKIQEFGPKIENFKKPSTFCTTLILSDRQSVVSGKSV